MNDVANALYPQMSSAGSVKQTQSNAVVEHHFLDAINQLPLETRRQVMSIMVAAGFKNDDPLWALVAAIAAMNSTIAPYATDIDNLKIAVESLRNEIKTMPDVIKDATSQIDVAVESNLMRFGAGVKKHIPAAIAGTINSVIHDALDASLSRVKNKFGVEAALLYGMTAIGIGIVAFALGFGLAR